jgi:NADH-quinone oxidoreductase subunit L
MFMEYAWLIPFLPLIAFVVVGFFGKKLPEGGGYLAIGSAIAALVLSLLVAYEFLTGTGEPFQSSTIEWLAFGRYTLNFGIYIDSLTIVMMLFASFISTLIFVYSIGYMHGEGQKKRRYYAEISLFLAGMLGLVMASNYLEMFIFWEIMGVCSYLLIGFWSFRHPEGDEASAKAASAAKKAFLVTRLGDVCFMSGLFVLLFSFGNLDFTTMFDQAAVDAANTVMPHATTIGALLLFGGVIGKSAQFPLQDWLPDAMAGPTTVSALIHAATMVKAGVYLVARSYPLFIQSAEVMLVVALIGGLTAFIAATMAMNNMNLKRVLAYSTVSQLGFMIMALGAGGYLLAIEGEAHGVVGYTAGVFHMMNHAFFKALLFMCAGSVIHAAGTEDMRQLGGLSNKMKITSLTMLIGSLSIAGFPLMSGFWSKDMIFEAVLESSHIGAAGSAFAFLFVLALVTAFMTAFYMFRMWFMTFRGKTGPASEHCHGESPRSMTIPLIILSAFAIGSGFLIFFGLNNIITFSVYHGDFLFGGHGHTAMEILMAVVTNPWTYVTIALALLAIFLAYKMYDERSIDPGKFNANGESPVYKFLTARYMFPQLYDQISWKLGYGVAKGVDYIDRELVDGTVNGMANALVSGSESLRKVQTGNVRNYAAYVILGVLALAAVLFFLVYYGGA